MRWKIATLLLVLLLLAFLTAPTSWAGSKQAPTRKTIVISIDGLRPAFYLDARYEAPTLRELAETGVRANGVFPVFPSLTYPGHATLVTGVQPAKHGIVSNTVFSNSLGVTDRWYWEKAALRSPTLWEMAKAAGKSVAIVRWPSSVGAQVDWLVPEIFSPHSGQTGEDWRLIREHTRPELMEELLEQAGVREIRSAEDVDGFTASAATHILRKYRPDLTFIHLIGVDLAQHHHGSSSPEVGKALTEVDRIVSRIVAASDLRDTAVVIVGDHGFKDYTKAIHPNTLFTAKGWIRLKAGRVADWEVLAHTEGGQAAVYVKDPRLHSEVLRLLDIHTDGKYRVISKEQLEKLGSYPGALCALEAADDYAFGPATSGPLIRELAKPHGTHGQLPSRRELRTGFIAAGAGTRRAKRLNLLNLIDVAPSLVRLMGLPTPSAVKFDGKAIDLD